MAVNGGPPLLLLVLAGAALLVGLWLLWRGWRGRRVGDAPFCAACGYSLVGRASDRCPECGANVSAAGNVIHGRRVRGHGAMAVGAVVAVLAGLFLLGAGSDRARNFDWYSLKPTGYVLDDLAPPNSAGRDRAWRELTRRQKSGNALSPRHHDRLVDIALAEQGATTPTTAVARQLVEWLGDEELAGRLSDGQKERFYGQMARLTLAVRPTVVEGDGTPYRVSFAGRGPTGNDVRWWEHFESVSASVDGGPPVPLGESGGSYSGLGSAGSTTWNVAINGVGRHELKVTMRVEVWSGPQFASADRKANMLRHSRDVTLAATVDVVPDTPANRIGHQPPDPAAEARLRAAITPQKFRFEPIPRRVLTGELSLQNLPVDISFAAFARVGGKEYPLGTITHPAGGTTSYYVRGDYDGPVDPTTTGIDVVLRPDDRAARRTVDLFHIWDGTLEFKGVPVKLAIIPATGPIADN